MSIRHRRCITAALACVLAPAAQAQESFKIGIVSFLSGQAAESFGIPAVNGAKVLVEAFNKGEAPAPYSKEGLRRHDHRADLRRRERRRHQAGAGAAQPL
jgi:branched-chain amino acid transport system substrate-binding protein